MIFIHSFIHSQQFDDDRATMIERLSPLPPSAYHHPPLGQGGVEMGVVGVSATLNNSSGMSVTTGNVAGIVGGGSGGVSGGGGGGGEEGTPNRRARGLSSMSNASNERLVSNGSDHHEWMGMS